MRTLLENQKEIVPIVISAIVTEPMTSGSRAGLVW
jgi:hypothetical protein